MVLAWQSEQDAHDRYPMLVSLDRAAKKPDGAWTVCATARFSDRLLAFPFALEITIPPSALEARPPEDTLGDATVVNLSPSEQRDGCSLAKGDPTIGLQMYESGKKDIANWLSYAPQAEEEFRRLKSEAGKEGTFFWIEGWPVLIFVSSTPLRVIADDESGVGSEVQEQYVAFTLHPWRVPPQKWRLLYLVPLGIAGDAILGPIEWILFAT